MRTASARSTANSERWADWLAGCGLAGLMHAGDDG